MLSNTAQTVVKMSKDRSENCQGRRSAAESSICRVFFGLSSIVKEISADHGYVVPGRDYEHSVASFHCRRNPTLRHRNAVRNKLIATVRQRAQLEKFAAHARSL